MKIFHAIGFCIILMGIGVIIGLIIMEELWRKDLNYTHPLKLGDTLYVEVRGELFEYVEIKRKKEGDKHADTYD